MSEPRYCEYMVYRATLETPAEFCPNEAVPGEDFCVEHLPPEWDEDEGLWVDDWWDPVDFYEGDYE